MVAPKLGGFALKAHILKLLLILFLSILTSACSSLHYYSQSVVGHSRLMLARKPIDRLIATAPSELADKLVLAQQAKQFAIDELSLPITRSYESYVELGREYPVWTVVAAKEFSLDSKQWCYPVIGCASYRGYFSQSAAQKYAESIQLKGYETVVNGASAYSTLGWFADPLLPSMMRYGDVQLVETLFHEMAHQKLYINGDSDFNEAFASVIAEEGVMRWLASDVRGLRQNNSALAANYRRSLAIQHDFYDLLNQTKAELGKLYRSGQSVKAMAIAKQQVFEKLHANYLQLVEERWNGKAWYQAWFEPELNNAKFVAISTYRERVDELRQLLRLCENKLDDFYRVVSLSDSVDGRVRITQTCD